MTFTSVLYRSAVGRSAIPYCNSNVVIKVGGRQVGRFKKHTHSYCYVSVCILQVVAIPAAGLSQTLYDCNVSTLQVGGRQVGGSQVGTNDLYPCPTH